MLIFKAMNIIIGSIVNARLIKNKANPCLMRVNKPSEKTHNSIKSLLMYITRTFQKN